MKIAILAFSKAGNKLAEKIQQEKDIVIFSKFRNNMVKKNNFRTIWNNYDLIIFISATGIAVRYIAPFLEKKDKDPAVLVIDDQGRYVISLLSGHLGGANKYTHQVSQIIGATPVITTASDSRDFQSLDLFAKENNYVIEDLSALTPITSAMVDGKGVAFFSQEKEMINYPNRIVLDNLDQINKYEYVILVTHRIVNFRRSNLAILRPKILHLGIGSKKNAKFDDLLDLVETTFREMNISILSIKDMASIDIKKDEKALIELSQYLKIPFYTYTAEELSRYESQCEGSEFVKRTVGVKSVSCTSALKNASEIILDKKTYRGFTLSITKEV